ncbi:MAG: hypothetical protein EOM25_12575 [Deltaproteobacteria bacterium]|nr:hypothetical protein [Deltaproteobacteria bacterium]
MTDKRDVGSLLRGLIRQDGTRERPRQTEEYRGTTLGVPLIPAGDDRLTIDLTGLRVFRNLHSLVRLLCGQVLEQCGFGAADIMVRQRMDPRLTPDLALAGLDWITVYVRADAAEGLPFAHLQFENRMQAVFRALQTRAWGGILFPALFDLPVAEAAPPALLFPFHLRKGENEGEHYFLLEHDPAGRFLRLTVEDAAVSRLQLKHIRHRVVDLPPVASFIPDVHLVAETLRQSLFKETLDNRNEYREIAAHQPDLFEHLHGSGLPGLKTIHFRWPTDDVQALLLEARDREQAFSASLAMLMQEIQLLEDPRVLAELARGRLLDVRSGSFHIYFDLSRFGACLNVSFDVPRTVPALNEYLRAMPVLNRASAGRPQALAGVRVFLIHHATAEVLGLVKALDVAGCPSLATFFVKYAGIVPEIYIETLMALPAEQFRFHGLQKLESREHLAGYFAVSRQFGPKPELHDLDRVLLDGRLDFLQAMRLVSGHVFLQEVLAAREAGEKMLLVEDGGYLAPVLNRFCLEGASVGEIFDHFRLPAPEDEAERPLGDWLNEFFLGAVEHTRNGYDANLVVERDFGRLHFPVGSIAVSGLKTGPEARECAISILASVEAILHRLGLLMSRRDIVVLGSRGAIGAFVGRTLLPRMSTGRLLGVDIVVSSPTDESGFPEAATLDELDPGALRRADLFIGVVGLSILEARHLEDLVLNGSRPDLFFVSGSTKTVEFTHLSAWLQNLRLAADPRVGGLRVKVSWADLRDLQTGALQGQRVTLAFPDDPARDKQLYLLAELTPINFLHYGIPREIIDEVMAQLFRVSCGLVRRQTSDDPLPPALLAVDRQIDVDAGPLKNPR